MTDTAEQPETCGIPVWYSEHRMRCDMELAADGQCPRHGRQGSGYARALMDDYGRRSGQPDALNVYGNYEMHLLRDMLTRLEIILDDEGVDPGTARRVIRCMLYGSPSQAAAELRRQQEEQLADILKRTPPPVIVPKVIVPESLAKRLGMPPR
jgi:hypothetical protein